MATLEENPIVLLVPSETAKVETPQFETVEEKRAASTSEVPEETLEIDEPSCNVVSIFSSECS
jgi:hypothetical protein